MNTDTAKLYDMIHVLVDGKTFYREAAAKVTRPDLKRLFEQMAQTKSAIADDIKNKVVLAGGEPLEEGSTLGGLRKAWAELRTKLSHDREAEYVSQLEEFEDRILDRNTGQMVNPNMEWYLLAGMSDVPPIDVRLKDQPERGVVGIGEPPTVPTAAAIALAVRNAIGATVRSLPLTPNKILQAMQTQV